MTVGLYNMAHDPDLFERPWEFVPERWTRATKKQTAFANIPFGFGPRGCYGEYIGRWDECGQELCGVKVRCEAV